MSSCVWRCAISLCLCKAGCVYICAIYMSIFRVRRIHECICIYIHGFSELCNYAFMDSPNSAIEYTFMNSPNSAALSNKTYLYAYDTLIYECIYIHICAYLHIPLATVNNRIHKLYPSFKLHLPVCMYACIYRMSTVCTTHVCVCVGI